jgi:hypothetical protein
VTSIKVVEQPLTVVPGDFWKSNHLFQGNGTAQDAVANIDSNHMPAVSAGQSRDVNAVEVAIQNNYFAEIIEHYTSGRYSG